MILAFFFAAFEFAGLSLATTTKDLAVRYPTAVVSGPRMHVNDDGIAIVEAAPRVLKIFFDERKPPACASIAGALKKRYGVAKAVKAMEEKSRVERHVWSRAGETLTLSCFSMGRKPMSAERITIER